MAPHPPFATLVISRVQSRNPLIPDQALPAKLGGLGTQHPYVLGSILQSLAFTGSDGYTDGWDELTRCRPQLEEKNKWPWHSCHPPGTLVCLHNPHVPFVLFFICTDYSYSDILVP